MNTIFKREKDECDWRVGQWLESRLAIMHIINAGSWRKNKERELIGEFVTIEQKRRDRVRIVMQICGCL